MSTESTKPMPRFSPFRNWLCLIGMLIALGSLFSFVLLLAIDLMGPEGSPYLGIFTFVVAPMFFILGMLVFCLGWVWQRRAFAKQAATPFLSVDLSRPQDRRFLAIFVSGGVLFLFFAAFGSYNSYHFAESEYFCGQTCHTPMRPEHVTYLNSPHARVACTACHVGPGALSFVKAKLNGVNQLKATLLNTFDRPVHMPDRLRPTQMICEECHWRKKYIGDVERTYTHYLSDETNTPTTIKMILKVGGGDPTHGPVGGIHWHMNIANKVEYISTNADRQVISWVRLTDPNGKVTVYTTKDFKGDPSSYPIHRVDCMDCHTRPAHQFRFPADAVDLAMSLGKIDPSIRLIKSNAVALLTNTNYSSDAQALEAIAKGLRTAYPTQAVDAVIAQVQQIYTNNFFPDMKADFRAYPDNLGHKNWPGCFRCHDGQHKSTDGTRTIQASNCNDCHLILGEANGASTVGQINPAGIKFVHPDSSSEGTDPDCYTCHSGGP